MPPHDDPERSRPTAPSAPTDRTASETAAQPDPLRALLDAVRLVPDVTAGAVFLSGGGCQSIPGLPAHALLHSRSAVVAAAWERVGGSVISSSFLWPASEPDALKRHLRITVLNAPAPRTSPATALLLLSPAEGLHGLTPRELEVLGFVVEGACNQEIAEALVIAARTVATHLEHILVKLSSTTRTLAAVRAEQRGLYVPPARGRGRQDQPA